VHEEEVESRYEATSDVLIVIGLQATLAGVSLGNGWTLIGLPGWVVMSLTRRVRMMMLAEAAVSAMTTLWLLRGP
jgi:hypothetical protein